MIKICLVKTVFAGSYLKLSLPIFLKCLPTFSLMFLIDMFLIIKTACIAEFTGWYENIIEFTEWYENIAEFTEWYENIAEFTEWYCNIGGVARTIKVMGLEGKFFGYALYYSEDLLQQVPNYFLIDFNEICSTILAKSGGMCPHTPHGHATAYTPRYIHP